VSETAETLRNWRGLYKAALFETDTSKIPSRIEEARERSPFDPESYLKLPPIMTVKLRLSRLPFMPCKAWRIVRDRIQKIADALPEPVSLHQSTKTPCRVLSPEVRLQGKVAEIFDAAIAK
jgi:hypothetical protein